MQVGPTLQESSSGEAVKELQRALQRAGFDPGPIDGKFGPVTAEAVRSFQAARGLVVDGIVGPPTWCALPSEDVGVRPTLQESSSGEAVKELQRALQRAGFDPGPIDGKFGPVTAEAVRSFQAARGLVVDGIVGPPTGCALPSEDVGVRPTLQESSSGEAVKELQRALQRAGFDPGPIDGKFGPVTAEAVRSFQAA